MNLNLNGRNFTFSVDADGSVDLDCEGEYGGTLTREQLEELYQWVKEQLCECGELIEGFWIRPPCAYCR